jgi:hypothetical protein
VSFDRPCQCCKRDHWVKDGERIPLEVCWSTRFNEYRCQSCHFKPTEEEMRQ